jgi:RNase adapter protein RapZ
MGKGKKQGETTNESGPVAMDLVVITGISGSGKSVALRALEDAGYYCVDNLPPELIGPFVELEQQHRAHRVAIAMDARSANSLPRLPGQLEVLRGQGVQVRLIYLDSSTETLVHRFSETRRRHPLSKIDASGQAMGLIESIELERELLTELREHAQLIDTSFLRSAQLQAYVKELIAANQSQLTLVFESFAFKRGVPVDADFVFDVRMLPNPHYEPELRPLTGRDAPVAAFLRQHDSVALMRQHIDAFLRHWLAALAQDHRSYVTVGIGCTGGQHRSVFLVEELAAAFSGQWTTLKRHRDVS